jgi:DedD protein
MGQRTDSRQGARGLTVKQLTFIFIAGVGVCAVFFTLGFLVGTNERSVSVNGPALERVSPPGDIPPPVNAPLNSALASASGASAPADSGAQVQEQNISSPPTVGPSPAPAEAPPPAPSKETVSLPSSPRLEAGKQTTGFVIQIAALHSAKDAESMVGTLRSQGYPAFLVTPQQAGTHDGVYRVQVGPYPSRSAAQIVEQKLARDGFNPFIK